MPAASVAMWPASASRASEPVSGGADDLGDQNGQRQTQDDGEAAALPAAAVAGACACPCPMRSPPLPVASSWEVCRRRRRPLPEVPAGGVDGRRAATQIPTPRSRSQGSGSIF